MSPVTPIKNLGLGGLNKDTSPVLLPENVFTDGLNVRFRNGSVQTIKGETAFRTLGLTADVGLHWRRPDAGYTVVGKEGYINRISSTGTETAMLAAPSGYTGSKWQTDFFGGGYAVTFNDGVNTPLFALYNHPTADLTLQPFPGWNYLAGLTVRAKVVRSFNYSLVAANLTLTTSSPAATTYAPTTVRISVQAPIGGFPEIWQPGLTTDTADEFEVNSKTPIVELAELRGNMFIYSNDSIHVLTITNGIANVRPYAKNRGALGANCVVEFDGKHMAVDRNDIYIHNGSGQTESAVEGRMRDFFLADLNAAYETSTYLIRNNRYREVWICYVSSGNTTGLCDKAMIYNWKDNNWTIRALPYVTCLFSSPELSGASWLYGNERILATSNSTRLQLMDEGYLMYSAGAYSSYESYVTRSRLFAEDPFGNLQINGITPVLEVSGISDTVNVFVTSQNTYDKAPDFSNPEGRDMFTISPKSESQGYKVDPRSVGRFLNYMITSYSYWKLSFLGLDLKPANRR